MNSLKTSLSLAGLALIFFGLLIDTFFSYTMLGIRVIFFASGIFCAWGAIENAYRFAKVYNRKNKETVFNLIFKSGYKSSIVNILTTSRILICPVLLVLLFQDNPAFKWLLLASFLTDALDGFLARKFRVTTKLGAKLDSMADDILFVIAVIAVVYMHTSMILDNMYIIAGVVCIFLIKMGILLIKHNKLVSGLHTYFNKGAAFLQAVFFLHAVFFSPSSFIFYVMIAGTILALIEEIIIISVFKEVRQNVKGIFF